MPVVLAERAQGGRIPHSQLATEAAADELPAIRRKASAVVPNSWIPANTRSGGAADIKLEHPLKIPIKTMLNSRLRIMEGLQFSAGMKEWS